MNHKHHEGQPLPPLEEMLAGIEPGRQLVIEFTRFWIPADRPGLRLSTVDPGAPRRTPRQLCPVIMADEGQTHADLLELVAGALRLAQGCTLCNDICTAGQAADQNVFFHCALPAGHEGMHELQGRHWR